MCDALVSEVVFQRDYYEKFATDDLDVVSGFCRFVSDKDYNTDTCDLFTTQIPVTFLQHRYLCRPFTCTAKRSSDHREHLPISRRKEARRGDGAAFQYSLLLPHLSDHTPAQLCPPTFSPESVQPHPKAPPRKVQTPEGRGSQLY